MRNDTPDRQETDGTVTISAETAETALLELDYQIERMGGPDGRELTGATYDARIELQQAIDEYLGGADQ